MRRWPRVLVLGGGYRTYGCQKVRTLLIKTWVEVFPPLATYGLTYDKKAFPPSNTKLAKCR